MNLTEYDQRLEPNMKRGDMSNKKIPQLERHSLGEQSIKILAHASDDW